MTNTLFRIVACLVLLLSLQAPLLTPSAGAGEKEERIQALQEKMAQLKAMLAELEEQKLREQPPEAPPWQTVTARGEERRAYSQYAYLLAPQMRSDMLDSVLQQLHFIAARDAMTERGNLFVVPALSRSGGALLPVAGYNRDLAASLLTGVGIPSAVEGGILVTGEALGETRQPEAPLLFIDLRACDQILRARIFELLQTVRLFGEDGSIHSFLWELITAARPQAFRVHQQHQVTWLEAVPD